MRNLLAFIIRFHAIFVFVALQIFCFYLIVDNHSYHHAAFLSTSEYVSGRTLAVYSKATDYLNLKSENERLAHENAMLRSQVTSAYYISSRKHVTVNDTIYEQQYSYLPAKVIYATTNKTNNYITIDQGSKSGVKPYMGVIGPDGVVGRVKDVSEYFSSVITILHKDFRLSIRIGDQHQLGNLVWDGINPRYAIVQDVPRQVKVKKGDKVITSGRSLRYPEGIVAGTVESAELKEGSNFYNIRVKLATDFGSVQYVYIVDPLLGKQQQAVEDKYENEQ